MSTYNRGYQSPFQYAVDKDYPLARRAYKYFNSEAEFELQHYVPSKRYNPSKQSQVLGSLKPFSDMSRDGGKTWQPFSSWRELARDFLSPFRGLLNIVRGIGTFFAGLALLVKAGINALRKSSDKKEVKSDLAKAGSWFLNGLFTLIRGATQLAFAPLILARALITRPLATAGNRGFKKLEQKESYRELVFTLDDHAAYVNTPKGKERTPEAVAEQNKAILETAQELHRQFNKALHDSQKSFNRDPKAEKAMYANLVAEATKPDGDVPAAARAYSRYLKNLPEVHREPKAGEKPAPTLFNRVLKQLNKFGQVGADYKAVDEDKNPGIRSAFPLRARTTGNAYYYVSKDTFNKVVTELNNAGQKDEGVRSAFASSLRAVPEADKKAPWKSKEASIFAIAKNESKLFEELRKAPVKLNPVGPSLQKQPMTQAAKLADFRSELSITSQVSKDRFFQAPMTVPAAVAKLKPVTDKLKEEAANGGVSVKLKKFTK